MVELIWTDSAIQDLNDIGNYIAKDSIRYAEITVYELFESTEIWKIIPEPEWLCQSLKMTLSGKSSREIIE